MTTSTVSETPDTDQVNTSLAPSELGVLDDRAGWVRATFMVTLSEDFEDYVSMLKYSMKDEQLNDMETPELDSEVEGILDETGDLAAIPTIYKGAKFRDTSLGGSDVINPLPQFCADDDIIHPYLQLNGSDYERGMGRVYSEVYDDNQQIMYISCGVIRFTGLLEFYKNAVDGSLSMLMNQGDFFNIEKLASIFGGIVGGAVILPFLPVILLKKALTTLGDLSNLKISRYYNFKQTMPLYYKFVNTILQHIAVNLNVQDFETGELVEGSPFEDTDMDIFKIMLKKYKNANLTDDANPENIDKVIEEYLTNKPGKLEDSEDTWDKLIAGWSMGVRETISYIGFRIEKSVGSGESISNESGPSALASSLNSRTSDNQNKRFSLAGGALTDGVIGAFTKTLGGVLKGAAQSIGLDSIASTYLGSSYIDIPDNWMRSSFSTMNGANFKMALRAHSGDIYTYLQCIGVPLAAILAMALPRATGPNSYTSPFLINAHCKGKFTINAGLIDSITITRGSDQHGWSRTGLPTAIDVDFTIKDLSPAMFLALNEKDWWNVFATDSTFQSYLGTLSGRGLADTLLWSKNIKRRFEFAKAMAKNQVFNPIAIGYGAANTSLGRIITAFMPNSDLPTK